MMDLIAVFVSFIALLILIYGLGLLVRWFAYMARGIGMTKGGVIYLILLGSALSFSSGLALYFSIPLIFR